MIELSGYTQEMLESKGIRSIVNEPYAKWYCRCCGKTIRDKFVVSFIDGNGSTEAYGRKCILRYLERKFKVNQ